MRVHLTSTPEYSKESIDLVTSVLNLVQGEIQFVAGEPLNIEQLRIANEIFENPEEIDHLTFDELFGLSKTYRITKLIPKDEFVVLLTTFNNDRNWFSAFSNRNIFVNATGWEYFTKNDSKYGIAYQIVENVFQSLIGLDINNIMNEPNIHLESIGCINDMCANKLEVVDKLREGYICNSCLSRALQSGVDQSVLFQIQSLIYHFRIGLMNFFPNEPDLKPEKVSVYEKGKIIIGQKEIDIPALPNSLFIFFLCNLNGIRSGTLDKRVNELLAIYRNIRKGGEVEKIRRLCLHHDNESSTFLKVKWDLNNTLIKQLDRRNSEFYTLKKFKDGNKNIYKINLDPDYLKIDDPFKLFII